MKGRRDNALGIVQWDQRALLDIVVNFRTADFFLQQFSLESAAGGRYFLTLLLGLLVCLERGKTFGQFNLSIAIRRDYSIFDQARDCGLVDADFPREF